LRLVAICLVALLAFASTAHAQNAGEAFAPLRIDALTLEKSYRRARNRRNVGIALTIPGVALTLLGLLLIAYGSSNQEPHINSEISELVAGSASALSGVLLSIPGITFWMRGQEDMDVVKWRRQQLEPLVSGRGLQIRF
jgi:hypothetical protein